MQIYIPTILRCSKGTYCWKTATNYVESCQGADVDSEWSHTTSDGNVGGGEGECGMKVAVDVWASQIVSSNDAILLIWRVPLQCDTA